MMYSTTLLFCIMDLSIRRFLVSSGGVEILHEFQGTTVFLYLIWKRHSGKSPFIDNCLDF